MNKEFDVVVFGATGFTGALIARYLLQISETDIKWAIAGRNAEKLELVKQELKQKLPTVSAKVIDTIPVLVADSANEQQLVELAKKTKVVIAVVGPYTLYGELLVKACAENGTHYCDLTGEVIWIDKMIAKYGAAAQASGAVLVNCCGFESVPSDLTTFLLADTVKKHSNTTTSKVSLAFTSLEGAVSGGTLATMFTIMETATLDEMNRSRDPFLLTDDKTRAQKNADKLVGPNSASMLLTREKDLGNKWSSVFVGAFVNQAVIHRSNFLLNGLYGDKFVYRERGIFGSFFSQIGMLLSLAFGGTLVFFSWTRALVKRYVAKPGEGPSEEVMKNGKFVIQAVAYDESGKLAARATTVGSGDPGYSMTSKVIAECAICLAKGELLSSDVKGGFYTTASAFGHKLTTRLHDKQIMTFDVQPVKA